MGKADLVTLPRKMLLDLVAERDRLRETVGRVRAVCDSAETVELRRQVIVALEGSGAG